MKLNPFLNLLLDGLLRPTIRRIESLVATKRAPSRTDFPIPIRAAEARIDADFLHAPTELLREVVAITVETAAIKMVQVCWDWGHIKTIPGSLIAQGLSGLNNAKIQTIFKFASSFKEKNQIFMTLLLTSTK